MELPTATDLIRKGVDARTVQSWIDLGAGEGLFTKALGALLKSGSSIIAIDKKQSKIKVSEGIKLEIKVGDFLNLDLDESDGIIIANALHYVKDQQRFLKKLESKTGRLIIVEYNTDNGNTWVPYPVSFNKLKTYYPHAELIGQAASAYHKEGMYAALILF